MIDQNRTMRPASIHTRQEKENLKKLLVGTVFLVILSGCAGPTYLGSSIEEPGFTGVVIVHDEKTREGFQKTMESWLTKRSYEFEIVPEGSKHDPEKLTLEYLAYWSWDLKMYLDDAYIEAFNQGQQVGKVLFKAPNTFNTKKWGSAEKRIMNMMDFLFGEISLEETNARE